MYILKGLQISVNNLYDLFGNIIWNFATVSKNRAHLSCIDTP